MARIDWIEQRLQEWARWRLMPGSGMLGYAGVDLADADAGRGGYVSVAIPTSDVQASEMDELVTRLPGELRATVLEVYVGRGGEREHLAKLCCTRSTMYQRIDRAHRLLADHLLAKQQRQQAERDRVETLKTAINVR